MGLKTAQYQSIMREYEKQQMKNHDILKAHYKNVYDTIPEYRSLDESISSLSVEHGKRLLEGDKTAVNDLKNKLAEIRICKEKLLTSAGFPSNYLDPVYQCNDCHDTGYIGNEKCHCFKQAIIDLLYEQSNLKGVLEEENFDHFSFDLYSSNFIDPKSGRSAKEAAQNAYNTAKQFVANFDKTFQNLFLLGDVGVGKTFLTNCIAKELIDQGFSVLYMSASGFFTSLANKAFGKDDSDADNIYDLIHTCDLLIIDDLGTEYTNKFVSSQFFTCINERLLSKRSTIISTNLSLDSLADLYTERSFSRITSNYTMIRLFGDDIRLAMKLKKR